MWDVECSEAAALLRGVMFALELGLTTIHLERDCVNMIRAIAGARAASELSPYRHFVFKIRKLLGGFAVHHVSHVRRERNSVAHFLA
ncbi:unnamed protein product [Camellia sinensis]